MIKFLKNLKRTRQIPTVADQMSNVKRQMSSVARQRSGQLLLEALLSIAAAAIVIALGSQLVIVSLRSNKSAGDINVALGLSEETRNAVKSVASEKWQNIYDLEHSGTAYYPAATSGKWIAATGTEAISINNVSYSRSFTVQHVCRDVSTRAITGISDSSGASTSSCSISGGAPDPSTENVSTTVNWADGSPITAGEYITRWKNKACLQTSWSSVAPGGAATCPDTTYESRTNIQQGNSLQICNGC